MSEAKHTSGPWSAVLFDSERPGSYGVMGPDDNCVADCDYKRDETNEANARLMAAAPDMLAALQDIRAQVNFDVTRAGGLFCEEDIGLIDAAIAKATGAA